MVHLCAARGGGLYRGKEARFLRYVKANEVSNYEKKGSRATLMEENT